MKSYLVLKCLSLGYELFDMEDRSITLHPSRKKVSFAGQNILIGDFVTIDKDGMIDSVLERKNYLTRPRLSNADLVLVFASVKKPEFSSYLLDKYLSLTNYLGLKSAIVLTKVDLLKPKEREKLHERMAFYERIGYAVYFVDALKSEKYDFEKLKKDITGLKVALMGQTGVGKSTLLNSLSPSLNRKVDSLQVVSGRGRHTTKEVVLLPYENGFVFDTPGFSELDLTQIKPKDLSVCFPGYMEASSHCKFNDCHHHHPIKECEVLRLVEKGYFSMDSYENYVKIYEEVKVNDLWKKKLS